MTKTHYEMAIARLNIPSAENLHMIIVTAAEGRCKVISLKETLFSFE